MARGVRSACRGECGRGQTEAVGRLRATKVRTQEPALDVGRQHARASRGCRPRLPHRAQHGLEGRRGTRHGGRAEGYHPVARQPGRHGGNTTWFLLCRARVGYVVYVMHVMAFETMHMDVDEAGNNVMVLEVDVG